MGWGAALRLAVNKELAARAKNRAQNASLDEFYALKSIGGWRQGVSCLDWVTRKDGLALTVQWARRRDPAALGCVPAAFELPRDRVAWATAASAASSSWWIAKPANGSNSDGIRLLSAAAAAGEFASAPAPGTEGAAAVTVLQQYVPRPALIGGLKFDLRLYVLVLRRSRASAPVALLFWDGLARFATAPYACPAGVEGPTRARSQAAGAPAGRTETRGAAAPRSEDAAAPLLRAHLTNYSRQVQDERGAWERVVAAAGRLRSRAAAAAGDLSESQAPPPPNTAFIESADEAGAGGVDKETGRVLAHKWSARAAVEFIAAQEEERVAAAVAAAAATAEEAVAAAARAAALALASPASSVLADAAATAAVSATDACAAASAAAAAQTGAFAVPTALQSEQGGPLPPLPPPLWSAASRAIADALAEADALDEQLAPASRGGRSPSADGDCSSDPPTFELIGVDVLPDAKGNAWILEVQRHPSLLPSSPFDQRVKAGAVEAVHALLAAPGPPELRGGGGGGVQLPPAWVLCTVGGGGGEGARSGVAGGLAAPVSGSELAGWRTRAACVAHEAALDSYEAECARRELYF